MYVMAVAIGNWTQSAHALKFNVLWRERAGLVLLEEDDI